MPEITQKLKPWITPNYVQIEQPAGRRQDGFVQATAIPLGDLDAETLSALCDQFRYEVFQKAGKPDPSADDQRA